MEARAIWNGANSVTTSSQPHCTPFSLPSRGVLSLAPSSVLTLTSDAVFQPECTGTNNILVSNTNSPSNLVDLRDPFYSSTLPQLYALAAATVIAYMLVIMLLITPRTFLHEGSVVLGRQGFTNGPSGSDAGIGIGGRPWLQKVAAGTVAISLTIATSDTFKYAERQYNMGIMDALKLEALVADGTELKVIRIISDTFLWLAQAQTLIRLFPRQREKVIIKWTAFALISLDALFSTLNDFVYDGGTRPHSFVDAVPALSYLFELALSLLYCAWVMYYSITKKRFAFYHSQMWNICLVAILSFVAILVPVVFFVLDISQPNLAVWGDYVRWVGAAAASVVVWEWVERIEALERNDKKDGVLGREVFDGDEMLDLPPLADSAWNRRSRNHKDDSDGHGGGGGGGDREGTRGSGVSWPTVNGLASSSYRHRVPRDLEEGEAQVNDVPRDSRDSRRQPAFARPPLWPTRPPSAATPVSRTETASAESTVYAIRYHPIGEVIPQARGYERRPQILRNNSLEAAGSSGAVDISENSDKTNGIEQPTDGLANHSKWPLHNPLPNLLKTNPFKKKAQDPPPEVSAHTTTSDVPSNNHNSPHGWDVRARMEDFAATQADRFRDRRRTTLTPAPLSVTVIPAPTRRRGLASTLQEIENAENSESSQNDSSGQESLPTLVNTPQQSTGSHGLDNPNIQPIAQQGAISFVAVPPNDRHQRVEESGDPSQEHQRVNNSRQRSSPILNRAPGSSRSVGMSVRSIPTHP
jgi:hypothetical protein